MHSPRVIAQALSYYNQGNTLEKTAKLLKKRYKAGVAKSSVSKWLKEFREYSSFQAVRGKAIAKHGGIRVLKKSFRHSGQAYNYMLHETKAEMLLQHSGLREYLLGLGKGCPNSIFNESRRCSRTRIQVNGAIRKAEDTASKMAGFAVKAARGNRERHGLVESFLLYNDACTIACEVPVWFWEKNMDSGISGHIDLLQVRNGSVWVLDYKPGASKENFSKVASQLYLYASAVCFRSGYAFEDITCAFFDDRHWYWFKPGEMNVKWKLKQ